MSTEQNRGRFVAVTHWIIRPTIALMLVMLMGQGCPPPGPDGVQVTTDDIENNAVTHDKLAPNSVDTTTIQDGQVTTADLADDGVDNVKLTSDASSLAKVSGGAMTSTGGNVGIGTSSPQSLLQVNGTGLDNDGINAPVRIISGSGGQNLLIDGNEIDAIADGLFLNNNTNQNVVLANGGGKVGVGTASPSEKLDVNGKVRCVALIETSSRFLKENIRPVENALDKVSRLQGVRFNWAAEQGGKPDLGFVAEDVAEVLPELVTWEKEGVKASGLKYGHLTAVAVEAVKDLKRQVDEKDKRIAGQQKQIHDLAARLGRMEAMMNKLINSRPGVE